MLEKVKVLNHASVYIDDGIVVYVDPFKINPQKIADYILITHGHYDHFSIEDIKKVISEKTTIIMPRDLTEEVFKLGNKFIVMKPGSVINLGDIYIEAVASYNSHHPKENEWLGYIVTINNILYYIPGDTDVIEEMNDVKCDVAFLPVGGKYTMDANQAANLANKLKVKAAVAIHCGDIVGTKADAELFYSLLNDNIIRN